MANSAAVVSSAEDLVTGKRWLLYLIVIGVAAVIYLGCAVSPPSLMDDSDAVVAQAARNMLTSGDWVTAHLDGVAFLEKPPLYYWPIAISLKIFGPHDWAARIPIALAVIALSWLTAAFGVWAFGPRAGFYAGLCMATCVGLFLFTRVLIPDVLLALTITLAMWAFLRALDEEEARPRLWAGVFAASLGVGLLVKSLVSVVFPIGAGVVYLLLTRQFFQARTWHRLRPASGLLILLAIAAPWHVLAAIRNPPLWAWTLHSGPGEYHGFLWFFFINEQLLRFLNIRYPRDYNTVPRLWFWLYHLLWLFPWSVYFAAIAKLSFKPLDRAGRTRLLAICWTGFLMVFFTFSTTQEYYSMPCYAALALLLGSAMADDNPWVRRGTRVLAVISACAALACIGIYFAVRNVPTPGDIASALGHHPSLYTLSLGHMEDLTFDSFAYLRVPLLVAAVAFLIGALGAIRWTGMRAFLAAAAMMVLFFHAARLAMVVFDPYLSSRRLTEAIRRAPEGILIVDHHGKEPYYNFASVFFYLNRNALLINGQFQNLAYGAAAPGAPDVFIDEARFEQLWNRPERFYLVAEKSQLSVFQKAVGIENLQPLIESGGKVVMTNHPLTSNALQQAVP